ncbi:hypothetical protein DFH09DRAFT_1139943, partial [Mycena vulgaris]
MRRAVLLQAPILSSASVALHSAGRFKLVFFPDVRCSRSYSLGIEGENPHNHDTQRADRVIPVGLPPRRHGVSLYRRAAL